MDKNPRSIRYTAAFKADKSGKYLLLAAASGDDHIQNPRRRQTGPRSDPRGGPGTAIRVPRSRRRPAVNIVADYLPYSPGVRFGLALAYEPDLVSADARKFASLADVVVVAAGFDPVIEGEGHDRTFTLPWGQDALIEAVAAANPGTIVTLTGGGGMNVEPWLDKVPALLHLYYPGQEGGRAVAQILFGKHDPEGKLPVTFDCSWKDSASAPYYYGVPGADTTLRTIGENGQPVDYTIEHIKYGDKLMVGYRYWTTTGKHPLFPFGFGLSYTTFRFANLQAPATASSGATVPVSFDVTNIGKVSGAEVAQLYISDPSAKATRPERELKGFEKIRLTPGETKHVTLNLDARAFSYWDSTEHKWTIEPGKFVIHVGDSSENTPLHADLRLN